MPSALPRVVVTAAVIERDGRYLVTQRLRGMHLGGYWEFPGGKCKREETLAACLVREIVEELGSQVRVGDEIHTVTHAYPERIIELHFFRCELLGEPKPTSGQQMRWVSREDLSSLEFPPADAGVIRMLSGA